MRNVIINNPENIPEEIVEKAIKMMEEEERRRVIEISIRTTGNIDEYGITPVFEPVHFDRIRRITGYLVGTTDRWNSAKRAELDDRVKHDA
jgi:hypothetical protein